MAQYMISFFRGGNVENGRKHFIHPNIFSMASLFDVWERSEEQNNLVSRCPGEGVHWNPICPMD